MAEKSHSNPGRIPPQDIAAEKSLLGAILISDNDEVFSDIITIIQPHDFYDKNHQTIFEAMLNLYNRHQPIDTLTMNDELKSLKKLKEIGGAAYLAELSNFVPTASHAKAYANIIEKASVRRKLISAGEVISDRAYEDDSNIQELIGNAEQELFKVSNKLIKNDYVPIEELLADAYERIEELHKNKGALRGLKSGFRDLDNKTAGFQKGDLVIIGARPAMGKTTFAQNIAYNIAKYNNKGVLFFSMEMASNEIIDRIISDVSGVDNWRIRTGNITEEEFSRIGDALGELDNLPLYIDDNSSMNILEIRNKARRAMHDHDIGIVIIDYLQLIQGSERYAGNRVQEVSEVSRGLKILARELKVPVVALAQLSRSVTGRDDPRPVLSDLRESGSIEQDADLVMFLHRPDYYKQNDDNYEPTHITELLIAKHRHGAVGKIELYFHPELLRFMSLDKTRE
ncbi:MAG: replicative DNA helicase [Candidatus Saccharibacteria bacterium]|nr:replicative DNA helicase [Candidatus Saccharibacteria bacterium]